MDLPVIAELPPDAAEDLRERSLTQTFPLITNERQEKKTHHSNIIILNAERKMRTHFHIQLWRECKSLLQTVQIVPIQLETNQI